MLTKLRRNVPIYLSTPLAQLLPLLQLIGVTVLKPQWMKLGLKNWSTLIYRRPTDTAKVNSFLPCWFLNKKTHSNYL